MRNAIVAAMAGIMMAAAAPAAAQWQYEPTETGGMAFIESEGTRLIVRCGTQGLVAYYEFPKSSLDREFKDRKEAYGVFTLDRDAAGRGNYYSFRSPLYDRGDRITVGAGYETASKLADWFSRGKRKISAGISTSQPGAQFNIYMEKDFSAAGSTAAIRQARKACS